MTPLPSRRWRWWLPVLLGAAGLAIFGDKSPVDGVVTAGSALHPAASIGKSSVARAVDPASRRSGSATDDPTLAMPIDRALLYPLRTRSAPSPDLFAARSWVPPIVAVQAHGVAALVPAPPSYSVLGKKHESDQWEVYLAQGEQTLIAREGETLDGVVRVDRIAPPTMTLTVLLTGQTMTLAIGDAR